MNAEQIGQYAAHARTLLTGWEQICTELAHPAISQANAEICAKDRDMLARRIDDTLWGVANLIDCDRFVRCAPPMFIQPTSPPAAPAGKPETATPPPTTETTPRRSRKAPTSLRPGDVERTCEFCQRTTTLALRTCCEHGNKADSAAPNAPPTPQDAEKKRPVLNPKETLQGQIENVLAEFPKCKAAFESILVKHGLAMKGWDDAPDEVLGAVLNALCDMTLE